jgi:cysteine desulfurase
MNTLGVTNHHPALADGLVYLDYNATTPVDPRVVEAAQPYLTTHFGNPSSGHAYAEQPHRALAEARQQLADLIGAEPAEMVFTAGGSEANNLAIRGTVLAHDRAASARIITQASEHPAVIETCHALQRLHGVQVNYLPVDHDGQVDPAALADALTPDTALVSIMAANNETGVLQPITELAAIAHARSVLFHTDAAQATGKIPIDVTAWGVDLLTIAGTENVAMAVALGAAADLARSELDAGGVDRVRILRDLLHHRLDELLPGRVQLNGHRDLRLPNTLNVSITGVTGDDLLAAIPGIAAATGAACHSATPEPSPVLLAMGHDPGRALSALRLTLGRWTTRDDIEKAAHQIAAEALAAHSTAIP